MTKELEKVLSDSICCEAFAGVCAPGQKRSVAKNIFETPKSRDRRSQRIVRESDGVPTSNAELGSAFFWPGSGFKRLLDFSLVALSFPVWALVFAVVACWISIVSPRGGVIFRQTRLGRGGRRFTMFKFRSMTANADAGAHLRYVEFLVRAQRPLVKRDDQCGPQLIPGGRFLRRSGLDELPQLLNVLRGEMSLVGPRPCLPGERKFFPQGRSSLRFQVRPGITGLWQTRPKGEATFPEMNALDERYVRESRAGTDLGILCRTPVALVRQLRGAEQVKRTGAKALPTTRLAS